MYIIQLQGISIEHQKYDNSGTLGNEWRRHLIDEPVSDTC